MPSQTETRTTEAKITIELPESLRRKFNRLCKIKLKTSAAQRVRELIQADLTAYKAMRVVPKK